MVNFLHDSRTMGALFRAYTRNPASLPEIVDRAKHSADAALSLTVHGWPVFRSPFWSLLIMILAAQERPCVQLLLKRHSMRS